MERSQAKTPKRPKAPAHITVVVNRATTPMDFDRWAALYVRAAIAADRALQADAAAAA